MIIVTEPALRVPPSGDEMGFAFPPTALLVETAAAPDDVMVDWAETMDVRAENAKKRAEVKRILARFGRRMDCKEGLGGDC